MAVVICGSLPCYIRCDGTTLRHQPCPPTRSDGTQVHPPLCGPRKKRHGAVGEGQQERHLGAKVSRRTDPPLQRGAAGEGDSGAAAEMGTRH